MILIVTISQLINQIRRLLGTIQVIHTVRDFQIPNLLLPKYSPHGQTLLNHGENTIYMTTSSSFLYITCKSCEKSLMGLDELIVMFDHIRFHDASHFGIQSVTDLVHHFENICDKFKDNTSHEEAERLVRYSISNMLDFDTKKFSVFHVNKEMLDYLHYKTMAS